MKASKLDRISTEGDTRALIAQAQSTRENLGASAYQSIRRDLMAGRFQPGQKLKLRDLADELGMSLTPIREALKQLVSEAALVQLDRRSVRLPILDIERRREITELRLYLEGKAAQRAVERATTADIDRLEEIHARLARAKIEGRFADQLLENERFHLGLCEIAQMPVLQRIVESLWLQSGPLLNAFISHPIGRPLSRHPHLKILKGLRRRDGMLARRAIEEDIMHTEDLLLKDRT